MVWIKVLSLAILAVYGLEPLADNNYILGRFDWLVLGIVVVAGLASQFKPLSKTILPMVLTVFAFDVAYQLAPSSVRLLPVQLVSKSENVVMLNEQPFFVFRPETEITSVGMRGKGFTYSWITDSLGFKNASHENEFDWVAIGDSFTEGMGSPIEGAWPNILHARGIPTYNLGVQGYSPSQSIGSLNYAMKNGIKFKGLL